MFDYITYVSFKIIFNGQVASDSCTTVSHPPAGVIARSHTYVTNLWQELGGRCHYLVRKLDNE